MPAEARDDRLVITPITLFPEAEENDLMETEIPPTKMAKPTTVRLTGRSPDYAIPATKTAGYAEGFQTVDNKLYAERTKTAYLVQPAP